MPTDSKKSAQMRNSIKNTNIDRNKTTTHKLVNSSKHQNHTDLMINHQTKDQHQHHPADGSHKIRLLSDLVAKKNPFAELVRLALILNPREFELPEDYVPDIQFPGSSKKQTLSTTTREGRYTSYSVKRAQELDRNHLPLILRTCYVCRKGCRKAPLIHCDYCPLVYHADCVDPPLTILPNTRWMCPNHVEPTAEEKLLTSSSFCERVKLWNHFSKPIDHERIKISFLDKVHESPKPELAELGQISKLGCRVPKRIKKDYDRFIREIDKYHSESDEDDLRNMTNKDSTNNNIGIPNCELDYSSGPSTSFSSSSLSNSDQLNLQRLKQEHESLIDIALRYMIESSKLLESKGHNQQLQPKNGDKNSLI